MARNKELTVRDVVQLVKTGCLNEYGRISIHLHDCTGRCVYDLDCEIEEMPNIVWREYQDFVSGIQVAYMTQNAHIDTVRMNGWYGVPLVDVFDDYTHHYWTNDKGDRLYFSPTPAVKTAYYYDTAYVAPYDCSTIA